MILTFYGVATSSNTTYFVSLLSGMNRAASAPPMMESALHRLSQADVPMGLAALAAHLGSSVSSEAGSAASEVHETG